MGKASVAGGRTGRDRRPLPGGSIRTLGRLLLLGLSLALLRRAEPPVAGAASRGVEPGARPVVTRTGGAALPEEGSPELRGLLDAESPEAGFASLLAMFRGQRGIRCELGASGHVARALRVRPGPARSPDDLALDPTAHAERAPRLQASVDRAGVARATAEPEDVDLVVDVPGAGAWRIAAPEGGDVGCTSAVRVAGEVEVRGRVVDGAGEGVPGARVGADAFRHTTADDAGRFVLVVLEARQRVALDAGQGRGWATLDPRRAGEVELVYAPGVVPDDVLPRASGEDEGRAAVEEIAAFVGLLDDVLGAIPLDAPAGDADPSAAAAARDELRRVAADPLGDHRAAADAESPAEGATNAADGG